MSDDFVSGDTYDNRIQHAMNFSNEMLRDYFAAKALQSVIGHLSGSGLLREECKGDFLLYAKTAYMLADAMLEARDKP